MIRFNTFTGLRKLTAFTVMAAFVALPAMSQKKVSVLGDSYSTYGGYVSPDYNLCWYNGPDGGYEKQNDVSDVCQTWWWKLVNDNGLQLERNNSWSGATVSCTGYRGEDYSDRAFISRINNLGSPDIIIVFGGTNDSWARVPIGEFQYEGWDKPDLYSFRPAFAYMLDRLKELYPDAEIINVTNSELSDAVTESMQEICDYYNVQNVLLHDIDKQRGHPSIAGMAAIAEQLKPYVCQNEEEE